jgi:hypothetical protein
VRVTEGSNPSLSAMKVHTIVDEEDPYWVTLSCQWDDVYIRYPSPVDHVSFIWWSCDLNDDGTVHAFSWHGWEDFFDLPKHWTIAYASHNR